MPANQDHSAQTEHIEQTDQSAEAAQPDENDPSRPEDAPKESPLDAVRRAQAERSLPPGVGGRGGRGGRGHGTNPSMPRRYNRGK